MDADTRERFESLVTFLETVGRVTMTNVTHRGEVMKPFSNDHYEGAANAYKLAAQWLREELEA